MDRFRRIAQRLSQEQLEQVAQTMSQVHPLVNVCIMDGSTVVGIDAQMVVNSMDAKSAVEVLQSAQVALQRVIEGVRMQQKAEVRSPGGE